MKLRTERLILRDFEERDFDALHEIERDPRVTRYMPYGPHKPAVTQHCIDSAMMEQRRSPRRSFDLAITLAETGTLIGRCGLGIRRPEHREAMIWYLLHPRQTGHGYAREAAGALLRLAFGRLRLHRVYADCDPRNRASCRVARALKMKREGCFRENYYLKGEWCDTVIFSILAGEWRGRARPAR